MRLSNLHCSVAPHVGAWIETDREHTESRCHQVAPHVGAWIETLVGPKAPEVVIVAPHVGAWIETKVHSFPPSQDTSLPTWERGLKQSIAHPNGEALIVSRSPCGSVD